jgi:phosphoribosyl 1,2-cyclic phosphodiesterase
MYLTFYGTRGSYPTARRDQLRYGGNTTCLHFQTPSGQDLILDGGSGIRLLGKNLMKREYGRGLGQAHILVTHTHWDHILGYPFFAPFYRAGNQFTLVSAGQTDADLRKILAGQYNILNFPVAFEHMDADSQFYRFEPGETLQLGEFRVETIQLNHPGLTVGYRVEHNGRVVTAFTDTARVREIWLGDGTAGLPMNKQFANAFLEKLTYCARHSDLLIYDTHFLEHEMYGRYDWGHSTVEDALEIARLAQVKELVLFHHAPEHSDTVLEEKFLLAKDLARHDPFVVSCAYEGLKRLVGVL